MEPSPVPAMTKFIGYPTANHEQAEGLAAADPAGDTGPCSQQAGTRTAAVMAASPSFRSRRAMRKRSAWHCASRLALG
jgi:hypothetical protein